MVTLHPDELREIIIKPMSRFFDGTLALRVKQAKEQWLAKAQTIIDQQTDRDVLDATNNRLAKLREHIESEIAEINTMASRVLDENVEAELPKIEIPEAMDDSDQARTPLINSDWDFANQCRRLIRSKQYRKLPDPEYPDEP